MARVRQETAAIAGTTRPAASGAAALPATVPDPEREAIQADVAEAAAKTEQVILDRMNDAVARAREKLAPPGAMGAAFFGPGASTHELQVEIERPAATAIPAASRAADVEDEGQEVDVTRGEEMYGKPGTFSSYRVGPFSGKTRIRKGETREGACDRLRSEFAIVAAKERAERHAEFLQHFVKVANGLA